MNALRPVDHPLRRPSSFAVVRVAPGVATRRRPRSARTRRASRRRTASGSHSLPSAPRCRTGRSASRPSETPASRVMATRLVDPAELLEREAQREVVAAHAAVLLGERQAEQPHLAHLRARCRTGSFVAVVVVAATGATSSAANSSTVLRRSRAPRVRRSSSIAPSRFSAGSSVVDGSPRQRLVQRRPGRPARDQQFGHHAVDRGGEDVLHLHRLDDEQRLPGGDGVAARPTCDDGPCPASG